MKKKPAEIVIGISPVKLLIHISKLENRIRKIERRLNGKETR
jgi:hypothetical protein